MSEVLKIRPITFRTACSFILKEHRHHDVPQGHKFSIGCFRGEDLIGVAVTGRPTSRHTDSGEKVCFGELVSENVCVAEVTRLCTDGSENACSKLYAASRRIAKEMGYDYIITYILESEKGFSLKAAGWHKDKGRFGGKTWDRPSRRRKNKSPQEFKWRYYSQLS